MEYERVRGWDSLRIIMHTCARVMINKPYSRVCVRVFCRVCIHTLRTAGATVQSRRGSKGLGMMAWGPKLGDCLASSAMATVAAICC